MEESNGDSFNVSQAEVFEALGHPTRIKLLQILNGNPLPFSGLKRAVGLESNGLLTFHLGRLRGLVKLNPEGAYDLTDEGREALRMIEVGRALRTEPPPWHLDFRLPHHKAIVAGLALVFVGLIIVGALFGYAYVVNSNAVSSADKRNTALESHSANANATIAADSAKITADDSQIALLQADVSALTSKLLQDNSTIQSTDNQVSSLSSELLQDGSSIKTLRNQVALLQSQVSSFQAGCGSVITASTTLRKSIGPCSYGNGLVVGASNIVINCAGSVIDGTNDSGVGVSLAAVLKVTVENCIVTGFQTGFLLNSSSGSVLTANTADNDTFAFVLVGSSSNTLTRNAATDDEDSFDIMQSSNNNTLTINVANADRFGFALIQSDNCTLAANIAINNSRYGIGLYLSSYNVFRGNKANSNAMVGFFLKSGDNDNIFSGNTANNNTLDGFYLSGSVRNTLIGNTASGNRMYGYYDESAGSGTGGTANTYLGDICDWNGLAGSSPGGLGTPQP